MLPSRAAAGSAVLVNPLDNRSVTCLLPTPTLTRDESPVPLLRPHRATRLLVIDDDPAIARMLALVGEDQGYHMEVAADGAAGLALARGGDVDLVLLDLNLPGLPGLEVCRRLRAAGATMPILILSCERATVDAVVALEVGADDYIRKPFELRELIARINAHLRRAAYAEPITRPQRLQFPGLTIDVGRHEVARDGRLVALTPIEFRILSTLATQAACVVTRQQLIDQVWRRRDALGVRSLDAHLYRLRRKIEPHPGVPVYLHAVIGVGYRFEYRPEVAQRVG